MSMLNKFSGRAMAAFAAAAALIPEAEARYTAARMTTHIATQTAARNSAFIMNQPHASGTAANCSTTLNSTLNSTVNSTLGNTSACVNSAAETSINISLPSLSQIFNPVSSALGHAAGYVHNLPDHVKIGIAAAAVITGAVALYVIDKKKHDKHHP